MDDRRAREQLVRALGEGREEQRRREGHAMRGKSCPIQRPMFDKLF